MECCSRRSESAAAEPGSGSGAARRGAQGGRQSLGSRSLHLEIILELFVANAGNLPFVLSPCHWHSGAASPRTSCVPLLEVAGGVGGATLCKALHEPQRPYHAAPGSTTPSLRGAPHSKGQFTGSWPSPPGAPSCPSQAPGWSRAGPGERRLGVCGLTGWPGRLFPAKAHGAEKRDKDGW